MTTQTTQMKLIPAEERELLTSRYLGILPASARMASRVIESGARADRASDLPFVLRRLLALEDEVERLRAEHAQLVEKAHGEALLDDVYRDWPGEPWVADDAG